MSEPHIPRQNPIDARPWTFYALATLFGLYLLFLYGPMLVIYMLAFQGPNGGVTFPLVGVSLDWFRDVWRPGQMANIPVSFGRSMALASLVSLLTVVISVAAGLAFRRPFPGAGAVFYIAVASLVMPSLLVGFGIGLGFQFLGLAARSVHLRARRAADLDAALRHCSPCSPSSTASIAPGRRPPPTSAPSPWQRLRYVTLPILMPGILGVALSAFTLSYDEYARTTLTIGPATRSRSRSTRSSPAPRRRCCLRSAR